MLLEYLNETQSHFLLDGVDTDLKKLYGFDSASGPTVGNQSIVRTQLYGRPVVLPAPNTPGTENNKDYDDQRTPSDDPNISPMFKYIFIAGVGSFMMFYYYNNSNRRY